MPNIFIYLDHDGFKSMKALNDDLSRLYATDMVIFAYYKDNFFYINFPVMAHEKQARLKHLYDSFMDGEGLKNDSRLTLDQFLVFISCIKKNERQLNIASDGWYVLGNADLGQPNVPFVTAIFNACAQACAQDCTEINLFPYVENAEARMDANTYLFKGQTKCCFSLSDLPGVGINGLVASKQDLVKQMSGSGQPFLRRDPIVRFTDSMLDQLEIESGSVVSSKTEPEADSRGCFSGSWCCFLRTVQSKIANVSYRSKNESNNKNEVQNDLNPNEIGPR